MTDHISDDDLELYALDRLADLDVARLEEHLRVCEQCQAWLIWLDIYIKGMRAAAQRRSICGC